MKATAVLLKKSLKTTFSANGTESAELGQIRASNRVLRLFSHTEARFRVTISPEKNIVLAKLLPSMTSIGSAHCLLRSAIALV